MFTGTTPPEVKTLLQDLISGTKHKDIFVGCSGNFSVDKIMSLMGFNVFSNDVSLYSKLVADIILGRDTPVEVVNKELAEAFRTWPETKYKKLVEVMFAIRLSAFEERKNDYQKAFFGAWINQSCVYYDNTVAKLEKGALDFCINEFSFCDFVDFLKAKKGKGIGLAFPPTYKAGYEKIFDYVERSFDYERAQYNLFDPKKAEPIFRELLEEDENVIYSDVNWESLRRYEAGVVNLGKGKHSVFVYSSIGRGNSYYIERDKKPLHSKIPILPADYLFTEQTNITIELCLVADVNYFKAFYMANKVDYSTGGDLGVVFYADGRAFGFASFSKMLSTMELMFLQSDFVVNSDTQKLSKLLIMLLRSKEVRRILARKLCNFYEGLKTTVYTDKPVSMKYRGVFELERRDKGKLMYVGKFTEQTLNEIYQTWQRKNYNSKQP